MVDDLLMYVRVDRLASELLDQRADRFGGKRFEMDDEPCRSRPAPPWPFLQELNACEAENENRSLGPFAQVFHEMEQRRLGPVDVVEDDDDRALARQGLQQTPYGPEGFARRSRGLRKPDQFGDAAGDDVRVLLALEQLTDAGQRCVRRRLTHDLRNREVGRSLAVRHTTPDEHLRFAAHCRHEFAREPCLADPGLADERHDSTFPVLARMPVRSLQALQLARAADERRVEPARISRRTLEHLVEPPGGAHLFGLHGVEHEPVRLVTEKNSPSGCARLKL